jgi:hypothetical protein
LSVKEKKKKKKNKFIKNFFFKAPNGVWSGLNAGALVTSIAASAQRVFVDFIDPGITKC